jgi:CRP/FNR family cyclic AMP-dependent transcriptional regulator
LLEHSQQMESPPPEDIPAEGEDRGSSTTEENMRTPYGLEILESCMGCKASRDGFFCRFSPPVLRSLDQVSRHTIMPPGALLFVEGQTPRGVYIVCSGKVKLYTTSKDGKVLILKQAEAGEVLGLSAAISGTNYEMTAETALPCQLNFIGRQDFMTLLQAHSEMGVHATLSLSREFQSAYRDIHDLVLARSSSGKLARLLLSSCAPPSVRESQELHLRSVMTHEEMAQRIGASRETVTRLLSDLKKKRLIRLDGANLVIRNRTGLEALAV